MPEPRQAPTAAGRATDPKIPHSRPDVGEQEAAALREAIEAGWLAQGPRVAALEADVAASIGLPRPGVALSSGTAALYAGLRALQIGEGDDVLMPAYACASLVQAVRYVGATPRFVDCDPATLNPDPDDARRKLTGATAACIVPHLFGLPADIEPFLELGAPVIEDCAQTLGVQLGGRAVGSFGDLTVCSFYATKLVAGGEGGMLLGADADLLATARELRDCEDPAGLAWSFNFKMSDLCAAVAGVQLSRLGELLERRQRLAELYRRELDGLACDLPATLDDRDHAYFRFVVTLRAETLDALLAEADRRGVACSRPVGRLVSAVEAELEGLPGCKYAWERACSIPLYPALSDDEASLVTSRFQQAMEEAGG